MDKDLEIYFSITDTKEVITIIKDDNTALAWMLEVYEDNTFNNQADTTSPVISLEPNKIQKITNNSKNLNEKISKTNMQPDQMVSIDSNRLEEYADSGCTETESINYYLNQSKSADMPCLTFEDENDEPNIHIIPNYKVIRENTKDVTETTSDDNTKTNKNKTRIKVTPRKSAIMVTVTETTPSYNDSPIMNNTKNQCSSNAVSATINKTDLIKTVAKHLVCILPSLHNYVTVKNQPQIPVYQVDIAWKRFEFIRHKHFDGSYKSVMFLIEEQHYEMHFKNELLYWVIAYAREERINYCYCLSYCELLCNELMRWTEKRRANDALNCISTIGNSNDRNSAQSTLKQILSAGAPSSNQNPCQQNMHRLQPNVEPTVYQRLICETQTPQSSQPEVSSPQDSVYINEPFLGTHQQDIQTNSNLHLYRTILQQGDNRTNAAGTRDEERSSSRDSGFTSPRFDERTLEQTDYGSTGVFDSTSLGTPTTDVPVISFVTSMNPEATMTPYGKCKMCGTITNLLCIGCRQYYYCTSNCQLLDWQTHRMNCRNDCETL